MSSPIEIIVDTIGSPSPVSAGLGLLGVFVVWYIVSAFSAWYRLRHIPGPFLASFSYLWMVKSILLGTLEKDFSELRKYGPLVRTGPNSIVTNDPMILRKIASARTKYTKHEWFAAATFAPGHRTMITILDNFSHDKLKARTAQGYNGKENPDLEVAIDSVITHFIDVIRAKHLTTKDRIRTIDFARMSRYFTLDIITRLAYGKAFGFLDSDEDLFGYTGQIDQLLKAQNLSQEIPIFRYIVFSRLFFGLFGPKPSDEKGVGKIMGYTQQIIDEKFQEKKPTKDMMGSFIRHGMTKKECAEEALLQIQAGSDTTAVAIRTTLMYIMTTPRVYIRMKAMIKQCVDRNEVSFPITFEEAQKLPYLQAVILEGLRMRIPVTYGHYKQTPPEGDTINGVFIPGNTALGHNSLALTRTESIFGEDVDTFRPERFLDCDEDEKAEREHAIDMVFGGGRWMCAGKPIAFMELNKIFFELLRVFDFQLIYPVKGWTETFYFIPFHKDMWVRITEAET
ncbi:cytochrome P450 [Annulohypoxylon bovei var. microspora]|nr:cytochrome P450 [Annulohypoxylon bovei var. microspora]